MQVFFDDHRRISMPLVMLVLLAACSQQSTSAESAAPGSGAFGSGPALAQGYGQLPPNAAQADQNYGQPNLDELMQWERRDMGVAPTRELHTGAMHGPTPAQIPGGQVITTKGLISLLQQNMGLVFDVLGAPQALPNAIPAARAAEPGSFEDQNQRSFGQFLQQVTNGRNDVPLVFYCANPECWMSYNAALRAINLGYRNVLWYRGGLEAWQRAGQPLGGMPGGQPGADAPNRPAGAWGTPSTPRPQQQPYPPEPAQPGAYPQPAYPQPDGYPRPDSYPPPPSQYPPQNSPYSAPSPQGD